MNRIPINGALVEDSALGRLDFERHRRTGANTN